MAIAVGQSGALAQPASARLEPMLEPIIATAGFERPLFSPSHAAHVATSPTACGQSIAPPVSP